MIISKYIQKLTFFVYKRDSFWQFYYNFYKNKENFGFWTPANATKETFASEIYYREFRHYESFPFFVT